MLKRFEFLRKYIIFIPILILLAWAVFAILHENFYIDRIQMDFSIFYRAAVRIVDNPNNLYLGDPGYYHLPAFAYFFTFIALFPHWQAHLVLFSLNIFIGIFFILELNKILKLIGLENNIYRTIFISIICCSFNIYVQFYFPQVKLILALILFFIIRREFEWKKLERQKDVKYYLINYFLIVFSLSIAPYYIFIYITIIIHDIGKTNLLKKQSIYHYLVILIIFLLQNFILLLYPNLIIEYLTRGITFADIHNIAYLDDLILEYNIEMNSTLVFLIPLVVSNLIICFSPYELPKKLGLSGLCYVFFNCYGSSELFIPTRF